MPRMRAPSAAQTILSGGAEDMVVDGVACQGGGRERLRHEPGGGIANLSPARASEQRSSQ